MSFYEALSLLIIKINYAQIIKTNYAQNPACIKRNNMPGFIYALFIPYPCFISDLITSLKKVFQAFHDRFIHINPHAAAGGVQRIA